MSEVLETHEHAAHAAAEGRSRTALLIAILAAALAFSEQGARHAETRQAEAALAATDLWAEYQAKSIRASSAANLADLVDLLPGEAAPRQALAARLRADRARYENEPGSGKTAIAERAHEHEAERDRALLRLRGFENASAAFQLAIVLATASVITGGSLLIVIAGVLGAAGAALAGLALTLPGFASF